MRRGRRGLPPPTAGVVLAVVLGAVAGLLFALGAADRFVAPDPLDTEQWAVVSPGLDETVGVPLLGRGSHVLDGALVIRQRAFYRADVLTLRDTRAVGRVEVLLAPDSGVLRVILRGGTGAPGALWLTADAYRAGPAQWTPREDPGEPWVIRMGELGAELEQPRRAVPLGSEGATQLELTAESGEVRASALRVEDRAGNEIFHEDFRAHRPGLAALVFGAALGAVVGLAAWTVARSAARPLEGALGATLLCLGPPILVGLVPSGSWLWAVERLYLGRTAAWDLARMALAASLVPVGVSALLGTGVLEVPARAVRRGRLPTWVWPAAISVAALSASRELQGLGWLVLVAGVAILAVPWWLARRADQDSAGALLRDAPALAVVAALGWHLGLLPALAWRLLVLAASARGLLDRAPRAAADGLWILGLASIPATELAIRSTYLAEGWDAARLSGELAPTVGWRQATPFWTGSCGSVDASKRIGVVWAGGSSMGGAYQFRGEPDAFFPAQVHQRLCATLPGDVHLSSGNFGDGSRDTFTISRTIEKMVDDVGDVRLVVLYTGVNDVLTTNNAHTRKEREANEAERSEALQGLSGVVSRSRLLTGLGLVFRPVHGAVTQQAQDVPLPDAEENLRSIAKAAAGHGASVLLLTEFVAEEQQFLLESYAAMEQRVAEEYPHVQWFDVRAAMKAGPGETLLVDRNHLSRQGSERLADAVLPSVVELLDLAPSRAP